MRHDVVGMKVAVMNLYDWITSMSWNAHSYDHNVIKLNEPVTSCVEWHNSLIHNYAKVNNFSSKEDKSMENEAILCGEGIENLCPYSLLPTRQYS